MDIPLVIVISCFMIVLLFLVLSLFFFIFYPWYSSNRKEAKEVAVIRKRARRIIKGRTLLNISHFNNIEIHVMLQLMTDAYNLPYLTQRDIPEIKMLFDIPKLRQRWRASRKSNKFRGTIL